MYLDGFYNIHDEIFLFIIISISAIFLLKLDSGTGINILGPHIKDVQKWRKDMERLIDDDDWILWARNKEIHHRIIKKIVYHLKDNWNRKSVDDAIEEIMQLGYSRMFAFYILERYFSRLKNGVLDDRDF